jgi:hypothetical protein
MLQIEKMDEVERGINTRLCDDERSLLPNEDLNGAVDLKYMCWQAEGTEDTR